MDLSRLEAALSSKDYAGIADLCDELMLKAASIGVPYQEQWPYAVHLLGHLYASDMNSARFLWKSIPASVKERKPEVVAVWKIGQCLWTRDYAGVYEAVCGFDWSSELKQFAVAFAAQCTAKMFHLLLSAYSTISVGDTSRFLGMSEEEATNYVLQHGWTLDPTSQMLTVKQKVVIKEQKVDPANLQRLTEYVFHLEH